MEWQTLAPTIISGVGALLGVAVGAFLTYWTERRLEADRREEEAIPKIAELLNELSAMCYIALHPQYRVNETWNGEPFTGSLISKTAQRIEQLAAELKRDADKVHIVDVLHKQYVERMDIIEAVAELAEEYSRKVDPVIRRAIWRHERDIEQELIDTYGTADLFPIPDDYDDGNTWCGPANTDFTAQLRDQLDIPAFVETTETTS